MQPSPYTPGEVARELHGRARQLADFDERLAYLIDLRRLVGRIRVDIAPRGIGKTSLLREVQRRAERRDVLTLWVTAGEDAGLIAAIGTEITRATNGWSAGARRRLRGTLDELKLTVGVPGIAQAEATVVPHGAPRHGAAPRRAPETAGVRAFEDALRATAEHAEKEHRRGMALFVDEIQAADPAGLRTLAYAWQHLQSESPNLPAAVFAAGLPNAPDVIARAATFSERFAYRPLERLSRDGAAVALAAPATESGVRWADDALDAAAVQSEGYPYTLQVIGDAVWTVAGHPDPGAVLTAAQLATARPAIADDLAALFRTRWNAASPGERDFLRAMAAAGEGPVTRAAVAAELGVASGALSVTRARLLDKGLVMSVAHGELAFTIPGFADYVRTR